MNVGDDAAGAPGARWGSVAARLKEAAPGRERDEACRALVDELERAAGARDLEQATQDLSGLLADLDPAARAQVLAGAVERVYATAENYGALGDLFGGICEDLDGDARTHAALEAVRASLLCAHVSADELGDSVGKVLGSCYGALAGAARDSGLRGLSQLMGGDDARAVACAGADSVAGMARLWRLIYDMCDIPDGPEFSCALGRYDILSSLSSEPRLWRARARISPFLLHIATDHAMHEDYEAIYSITGESNMRIRYWLDEIYRQHGVHNDPHLLDRPAGSAFHRPGTEWIHLAMAVRYLVLELASFASWERLAYKKIVKRLDVENPDVTYGIMARGEEMRKPIMLLRNSFGAHIDWTFNRAKKEIDRIGLANIVGLARKVLMFQDSAYRAIPHKYYGIDPWNRKLVRFDPPRGDPGRLKEIEKRYEGVDIKLRARRIGDCLAMYESYLCLYLTYAKYLERLGGKNDTMDEIMVTTSEIYNLKYVFLELANITKELANAGLDMPFEPGFASRQKGYWRLRSTYAAHTRPDRVESLMQVLEGEKELLSHVPYDIEEIFQVLARLEGGIHDARAHEIARMTEPEMAKIEEELDGLRESTHAALGNRFADPHEEQRRRDARERFKSRHGLEGGGSRGAQAGHGADGTPGAAHRRQASPLREAEDALKGIGVESCPEAWKDDLVCGDHGGALARMRVHSALSREGGVEAMPGGPAGGGGPDMAVETGGGRLWISVFLLENVPRLLGAEGHVPGAGRAVSRSILEAARARLAGMDGSGDQAAMVVMDPDGAIGDHGGLEAALEAVGREMPWVGALAVVHGGRCEVRGVPRARVPLGEQARDMLRGLGAVGGAVPLKAETGERGTGTR